MKLSKYSKTDKTKQNKYVKTEKSNLSKFEKTDKSHLSKFEKPKISNKIELDESTNKNYALSKSVINESINVSQHRIVNEDIIKNRLILVATILLIAVSIFTVVFSIIRVENIKNNIVKSQQKIEELNNINNNIDYYNEIYAYEKIFGNDSIYDTNYLTYLLSNEKWTYTVKINNTPLTKDNYNELTDFQDGVHYIVILEEHLAPVYLPYNIAAKGSLCQGDEKDNIQDHFYIQNVTSNKNYTSNETYPIINDKTFLQIDNVLTYTFTGNASAEIYYTFMFAQILDLPELSF